MELTDRELALRWWNRKSTQEKTELAKKATFPERDLRTLTGNEIEWIWRNQLYNSILKFMKKAENLNTTEIQALNIPVVRQCNDFDDFTDLMDEAKYSVKEIFFNGKKHNKRKTNFEDFKDVFDNKVPVKYFFNKNRLYIWIANYSA